MQHRARAIWILLFLACGFTVISFNLIQIQLVQHDKYWKLAVENHLRTETIPAMRGSIFDSEGNLLAETQVRTDLLLDGKLVEHPEADLEQAKKQSDFQAKFGCEQTLLTARQCVDLEPALAHSPLPLVGGLHSIMDETGDAYVYCNALAKYCAEKLGG